MLVENSINKGTFQVKYEKDDFESLLTVDVSKFNKPEAISVNIKNMVDSGINELPLNVMSSLNTLMRRLKNERENPLSLISDIAQAGLIENNQILELSKKLGIV